MSQHNRRALIAVGKGYYVNNNGEVISPFSGKPRKLLKKIRRRDAAPYYYFTMRDVNNVTYSILVHKLAGYQKFGDIVFQDGIHIRHLDGDSLNNKPDNIGYGSASDNMMDKLPENRMKQAITASTTIRKFSDEVMEEIRALRKEGWTYRELMDEYNISSKGTMSHIINNKYVTKV